MRLNQVAPSIGRITMLCVSPVLLIAMLALTSLEARATCTISFPTSAIPVVLDGQRGADWTDAARLRSLEPCLDQLRDEDGLMKDVTVFTKKYTNALGVPSIAFFFEVQDTSSVGASSGACPDGTPTAGLISNGERIVLQFDPNRSLDAEIQTGAGTARDLQIVISHKWEHCGDPNVVANVNVAIFGRGTAGLCPLPRWTDITSTITANRPTAAVRSDLLPGYKVEIEIPLALLGLPATPTLDMGAAFAVINDFGTCTSGVCDGYGVAFPNSLMPIENLENPVTGCRGDWVVPSTWGIATFAAVPGAVTVSRDPDYSSNPGLRIFQCAAGNPTYLWYRDRPCRAHLEARLINNTGVTQTRNLLFLWSPRGTGDPVDYSVVGLLEGVPVPPGVNVGPFSLSWNDAALSALIGIDDHPCVRVFVLPPAFVPAFPRSTILSITSRDGPTGTNEMMTAYGLGVNQWTQKNISQSTMGTTCTSCPIAANNIRRDSQNVEVVNAATGQWPNETPQPAIAQAEDNAAPLKNGFVPKTYLLTSHHPVVVTQTQNLDRPPIVTRPGNKILMDPAELTSFRRGNVIVQVRTFGFGKMIDEEPRYNFIEYMGSITQLVPVDVLLKLGEVPFQFNVVNADVERTIFHLVDVLIPPSVAGTEIHLDLRRTVYAANEKRVVPASVRLPGSSGGPFKRWGLSLHGGVSFPHGDLDNSFKPGPNFAVDLEYRFNQKFSLEGIYGFHRFNGETFGPFTIDDLNIHQLSVNGKVYGSTSPVRPFFNFGGGAYWFQPGPTVRGGLNVGAGLQFDVTPNIAVEGVYNFHNVFFSGTDAKFSALQGGVRFRF